MVEKCGLDQSDYPAQCPIWKMGREPGVHDCQGCENAEEEEE